MKPMISVVTVNYNGWELTSALIRSLECHVHTPLEVIVVDNGSRMDEAALLCARHPHIRAIRSHRNLGFAGGNNLGIAAASGQYLLLLNNDTEVEQDTLHLLAERLDREPELGAVCPKIRFFDPPRSVQFAGYTPLTPVTLRNALIGFGEPDDGRWDTPCETPYAHGAAMMVRREAILKAGAMPEMYFLYYEELDWSQRITDAGYRIGYEPRCTVFHKESRTTGPASPLKTYYLTRNRLLFARRNRRGAARRLSVLYQTAVALPKSVVLNLLHGRSDLAGAALRGARDYFHLEADDKPHRP